MQIGAKHPLKVAIMLVLAVTAAYLAGAGFWSESGERVPTQASKQHERTIAKSRNLIALELPNLDQGIEYSGSGRNIFRKVSYSKPRPPQPPLPPHETERPPVSLPSIDLKFFGFAARLGHAMRVFLAQGEEVFVASEGEIVNRRYRIVRIGPSWVQIEDILTNQSENIPLTRG